jgi:hypothetical protein
MFQIRQELQLGFSGERASPNLEHFFDSFLNNHRKSAKNAVFPLDTEKQLVAWYRTGDAKTRMDTGENAFLLRSCAIRLRSIRNPISD